MKNVFLLLALIVSITVASCQKTAILLKTFTPVSKTLSSTGIIVPKGFTWANSRNIIFTVRISDVNAGNSIFIISVYDADPGRGGHILSKGTANGKSPFVSKIFLSNQITSVYILKTSMYNVKVNTTVQVGNSDLTVSMGAH